MKERNGHHTQTTSVKTAHQGTLQFLVLAVRDSPTQVLEDAQAKGVPLRPVAVVQRARQVGCGRRSRCRRLRRRNHHWARPRTRTAEGEQLGTLVPVGERKLRSD